MSKTTLHIEVQLRWREDASRLNVDVLVTQLKAFIASEYVYLSLNQKIKSFGTLRYGYLMQDAIVTDFTGPVVEGNSWLVEDVSLDCIVYLFTATGRPHPVDISVPEGSQLTTLPNGALHGLWDSLRFDPPIALPLLRFLVRMMSIARTPGLDLSIMNFNKVILFHGPPGTGKSSLCRALAQKLSIRLFEHYSLARLIEVNCQSLMSKYFSESGRLVREIFARIIDIAKSKTSFVCVVIDEIETLTSSRERAMTNNECTDGLRVTNQILTSLDLLRKHPNIVVFCTTNMLATIDQAFLDRVDYKQKISTPCASACYEIMRSSLNEMIRCGIVQRTNCDAGAWVPVTSDSLDSTTTDIVSDEDFELAASNTHGPLEDALHAKSQYTAEPDEDESKLWVLALKAESLSGRALRRLPFLSVAMRTTTKNCNMREALTALSASIDEELALLRA